MNLKLFSSLGKRHGRVILNYTGDPEKELTFFAEAFHLTAKDSVAALRQDPHFGMDHFDFRAFPIVSLYRHTLELYMKAVILEGAPMLAVQGTGSIDRERLFNTHNLDVLRQDLERIFKAFGWSWDLGLSRFKTIDDFRELITELHAVDVKASAFRYPMNTKGDRALAPLIRFNLFDFCDLFDELFQVFDSAATHAYETVQAMHQYMADVWEYAGYEAE
jgi:hypothetical protein